MKAIFIFFLLLLTLNAVAQQPIKIYYDNRDSSVVKFFTHVEVPLILAANPRFGFSTVSFSVSNEGKVTSIHNLLKPDDLFFITAKAVIEKSSGKWNIKPGIPEQNFEITFFVISDSLASRKKLEQYNPDIKPLLKPYIQYYDVPQELTLLPTITIIFKEKVERKILIN
ncbi:hypothetical protein SAMN06265348_107184 [Pedobacter westerhofensis]|uniref:TonB protein C-terminal n=1 Tax=Pedobacter westerhofensis TaxID=425512 RepID=A0A521E7Q9_9SPHI|nr:hypothetical protein [Pedobacter westerhofensis]SMO79973.1 hypothetical protein SAMN06265348_107184 [Pedobacter westerhofensis]